MKKVSCSTCPYWQELGTERISTNDGWVEMISGECRIHAPRLMQAGGIASPGLKTGTMQNQVSYTIAFPRTPSDLWCGEHPDFPKPLKFDPEQGGFNRIPTLGEAQRYKAEGVDNEQPEPLRRAIETGQAVIGGSPED